MLKNTLAILKKRAETFLIPVERLFRIFILFFLSYKNTELKIEITNVCEFGRCKLCSPIFRPTVKEALTAFFLRALERHIQRYLKKGGKRIVLTGGGEPLDAPDKLFGALKIISTLTKKLGITLELLTVYTNGVKLLSPVSEEDPRTYLDKLEELGIKDINLSILGSTKEERTDISGEKIGEIDFDILIPAIREKGIRVLTRTTLAKGYIDSKKKIKQFTEKMAASDVGITYYSDIFTVPPEIRGKKTTPGSKRVLEWGDDHRVDFYEIIKEIENDEDFEFISKSGRHHNQGTTWEFCYKRTGTKVLFGDLTIGNESKYVATYCYIKPDGSMETHNNAWRNTRRDYVSLEEIKIYRPGRDDI